MIGKTISHYSILEKLGEGGMGVVYKARDARLDRFVAIKVLPADKIADPERKQRFVQEAKAASSLNHPNIITIYDIGQADGVDFISMECVSGKALDRLIPRHGMRLKEALKSAVQIADALARAHAAGIVHRDLKPGNIMVNEHGLVKVLDFGLAKLTEATPAGGDEPTRTMRPTTEEGKIVGTVSYMSPEQAEGKKVDARSDIFSFGAVLYEMVTGTQAFHGDTKASTLAAILKDNPRPASQLVEGLPREVERLISRCLRKEIKRQSWLPSPAGLNQSLNVEPRAPTLRFVPDLAYSASSQSVHRVRTTTFSRFSGFRTRLDLATTRGSRRKLRRPFRCYGSLDGGRTSQPELKSRTRTWVIVSTLEIFRSARPTTRSAAPSPRSATSPTCTSCPIARPGSRGASAS